MLKVHVDLFANFPDPHPIPVPDPLLPDPLAHQTPEPQPLAWPQTQPVSAHPHGCTSLDGKAVVSHSHDDQDAALMSADRSIWTRSPKSCLLSNPKALPASSERSFTTTYSG